MRIVVALGGNALGYHPLEQKDNAYRTVKDLIPLITEGHELIITHGNGPQVGLITGAFEHAMHIDPSYPSMPLAEATAMTQGYIGFHLMQAFASLMPNKTVLPIVTPIIVDSHDPAIKHPTKPIGKHYAKAQISDQKDKVFKQDHTGLYREVVASPRPLNIAHINLLQDLLSRQVILIIGGGGGIPVTTENQSLQGVIDKDLTSAMIATKLHADMLIILTAVPYVTLNYHKDNEQILKHVTDKQAKQYIKEGHFAAGSMLPKVEACLSFVENDKKKIAVIGHLHDVNQILKQQSGTTFKKED